MKSYNQKLFESKCLKAVRVRYNSGICDFIYRNYVFTNLTISNLI